MTTEAAYLDDEGPNAFFARLSRLSLLLDGFQHRVFDSFGLRWIDYSVLRLLQLEGPPYQLSPTGLSDLVVRSTGGMTQIVDRLERSGLVERSPDPSDRRKVIVELTPEGLRLVKRANRAWVAEKSELLGDLDTGELELLDRAVRLLLKRFTADFERHPSPAGDGLVDAERRARRSPAPVGRKTASASR
jgi:DNA-binding MarR family transcriptional regulator